MITLTDELKTKLLAAQDVNEVTALLKAEGQGISPEDAERLWEEILRKREKDGKELSLDELEAVSGGADRDWLTSGCAATVEPGSWCGSNDMCYVWDVTYDHIPVGECSVCGGVLVRTFSVWVSGHDESHYQCARCGRELMIKNSRGVDRIGTR